MSYYMEGQWAFLSCLWQSWTTVAPFRARLGFRLGLETQTQSVSGVVAIYVFKTEGIWIKE